MKRFLLPFMLVQFYCVSLPQTPEELWSLTYPEPDTNYIHIQKMICDSEGNSYLTGYINQNNDDYITIKYNSYGIKLWTATYNSNYDSLDQATDIAVDDSGNVYVTGRSFDGGSTSDFLTIKYNSEGIVQWTAIFYDSGTNVFSNKVYLALDELGNIYVTGSIWGNATQVWNYITIKYNNNGTLLWSVQYDSGGSQNYENPYAIKCDNNGNVIVTGRGLYDYTTVKYNSNGIEQWVAEDDALNGNPTGLDIDIFNNIYIIGRNDGGDGGLQVIKYNSAGTKLWDVNYLAPGRPSDLEVHTSGYLYVTGTTEQSNENFCTLLKLSSASGSLVWSSNYIPDSKGENLTIDATGNIYVAASITNSSSTEYSTTVIKYNSSGTQLWDATYSGFTEDYISTFAISDDVSGNIYFLVQTQVETNSFISEEYFVLLKYNSSGSQQWFSTPDFDSFNNFSDFVIDNDGNIYTTGSVKSDAAEFDILTAKYDSSGNMLWSEFYTGPINSDDTPSDIIIDTENNVYVAGSSQGSGTSNDYVTIKYNSMGVEQWSARYNGPASLSDEAQKVNVDNSGNVFVTGNSLNANANYDIATIKYNSFGQLQWVKRYNSTSDGLDIVCGLEIDASGDVYVGGTSDSINALHDYIILKYNQSGEILWMQRYNGPASDGDQANAITLDNSANVYITGWSVGNGTNLDFATVKYNSNGIQQWVARWDDPANQLDEANSIAVDNNFDVYVTGFSPGAGTGDDYTTVKYNSSGIQQWVSNFNGQAASTDKPMFITLDGYNEPYIIGQSDSDVAFVKYNSDGILQSQTIYNPFSETFTPSGILVDNFGNIYTGGTASASNWSLWYFRKYKQPGFVPIGVKVEVNQPSKFILCQNYPNPFNPSTTIQFSIPEQSFVTLEIFNILGEKVSTLVSEELNAGNYKYEWSAKFLPSGIYIYQLKAGSFTVSKVMLLIK